MSKSIERATGRQGRIQRGLKSKVFNGFSATDQFNPYDDDLDHYEDKKVRHHEFNLPNWSSDPKEQKRIAEEMSGDVVVKTIADLERERGYANKR